MHVMHRKQHPLGPAVRNRLPGLGRMFSKSSKNIVSDASRFASMCYAMECESAVCALCVVGYSERAAQVQGRPADAPQTGYFHRAHYNLYIKPLDRPKSFVGGNNFLADRPPQPCVLWLFWSSWLGKHPHECVLCTLSAEGSLNLGTPRRAFPTAAISSNAIAMDLMPSSFASFRLLAVRGCGHRALQVDERLLGDLQHAAVGVVERRDQ
jgi:hypothetical protein